MKALLLTREFPPYVYGGAGVHVAQLARALAERIEVEVRCFGDQESGPANPHVIGTPFDDPVFAGSTHPARDALRAVVASARMVARPVNGDVVHCHTWYTHWAGLVAQRAYRRPLVLTVHSLEPLRPWKREQLGPGYDLSLWLERTALESADAVIAVSASARRDVLRLFAVAPERVWAIPNGIDTAAWHRAPNAALLARYGVDPTRRYVLFLGRVSRQKGIDLFLRAAAALPRDAQVVLCATSPDTPGLEREVTAQMRVLQAERPVVWIREMVPHDVAVALFSGAAAFCCPSVYEPFGLINLEAMACETPVVATAVGGIPDVVRDGETGILVPVTVRDDGTPTDPAGVAASLAGAMTRLLADEPGRTAMGRRGRERAVREFGWDRTAARVLEVYDAVTGRAGDKEEA
ncbi:MAG: glycogen synthase [Gemmatimonadota bacterium]|nr:glycogen synthase [Gemmatimonadota bacterium]